MEDRLKEVQNLPKREISCGSGVHFLGACNSALQDLYTDVQQHGFVLVFREHGMNLKANKKGNVDVDIVFLIMRKLYEGEEFDRVLLVSGDGDCKRMVDYLIREQRFLSILLPCKEYASSLYKSLEPAYYDYIDRPDMRVKIGLPKK